MERFGSPRKLGYWPLDVITGFIFLDLVKTNAEKYKYNTRHTKETALDIPKTTKYGINQVIRHCIKNYNQLPNSIKEIENTNELKVKNK